MFINNKFHFIKTSYLNLLISSLPLALIIGNLATNINIILICIFGIWKFGKEIFYIKSKENYLIYLFFLYLIITTFFNNFLNINKNDLYLDHLLKSFYFLRYLIMFLAISKLIEKNEFNTNIFFISCAFFSFIVAVDVIFQTIFKINIFGYPLINNRASSFFKGELIAGGYLQKFILFFILIFSIKKKFKNLNLIIILSIIFLIPIILTGNRMPTILYMISILLILILEKKFKNLILTFIILSCIIFSFANFGSNKRLQTDLKVFFSNSINIINNAPKLFFYNKLDHEYVWNTGYLIQFNSGVQQWKQNKFFGRGLKSFRINCSYVKYQTCSSHPHNYFIEIMLDMGVLGLSLIYLVFFIASKNFLQIYSKEKNLNSRLTCVIFFILIFLEFLPLRSSGSFFTTNNATFLFLTLAIFLNVKKIQKLE